MIRLIAPRLLIAMVLGFLIAIVINEYTFLFMKSDAGRGPQTVELVIPAGTAERVAQGQTNPALPDKMIFVQGDTLAVKNEDSVTHKLGPLVIPPGTSASLVLSGSDLLTFTCTFQPTQYFGLDIREPVTAGTRVTGIMFAGVPLTVLFAIYSLLLWPLKPKPVEPE